MVQRASLRLAATHMVRTAAEVVRALQDLAGGGVLFDLGIYHLTSVATLFGVNHYGSGISGVAGLPIAVWEFSLGAYLVIKGFRAAGLQQLGFETRSPR